MNQKVIKPAKMNGGGVRDSGIELFRIISMLAIVAHHYMVHSGLISMAYESRTIDVNTIFSLLFGWGGKTGINCFVLITGYFMCKSKITLRKFLKLVLWIEFYKIIFYLIFTLTGYQAFSIKGMLDAVLPITSVSNGFTSAYLVFYLFIPFLNILIQGMDKKKHLTLVALCVGTYTVLATLYFEVVFNYVTWFCVIYLIGSYIRLYPEPWFENDKIWATAAVLSLLASWASVIGIAWLVLKITGQIIGVYYFLVDANMPLALITAVCGFMYFKNLPFNSRLINTVAASSFGVLLIHDNSTMRRWLWKDTLNNAGQFTSNLLPLHAICSVLGVYIICTLIDMARQRFIEKPLFRWIDKKL